MPPKHFIVEAEALPEIFRKVAEAKRLLDTGEAKTVHQATVMTGISRSAFYKYKDAVRPFNDMLHGGSSPSSSCCGTSRACCRQS